MRAEPISCEGAREGLFIITNLLFKQIDEEILLAVIQMGFDRNQLLDSLSNRLQNEVCLLLTEY